MLLANGDWKWILLVDLRKSMGSFIAYRDTRVHVASEFYPLRFIFFFFFL
jgi:hypothetical protein